MRRAPTLIAPAALVLGPTVLAFADGGYFADARLLALVAAYLVLALAAGTATRAGFAGLARDRAAWAAVGGLALLAAWTAVSAAWAPLGDAAADSRERTFLYLAVLLAAALAFRPRRVAWWAEPALAAGTVVVAAYGLLGQFGITGVENTASAGGRLDQPLTYWNAQGALAAMGLVLCARIAGSALRPPALRVAAAAATPLLAAGVYLTFSRGALTALAVGLAVLLALTPTRTQLRSIALALEAGVVAVVAAEALGDTPAFLVLLAAIAAAAAGQHWVVRAEAAARAAVGPLPHAGRVRAAAWVVAVACALAPFAAAVADRNAAPANPAFGATAERLGSAGSHRYTYWRVALDAFADEPAIGTGAGGFAPVWLERRPFDENVRDAHSLPLETAAELGLIGLLLLGLLYGGVAVAARRTARTDPALAAGPAAALAVWAAHSAIDWDWEMPALTVVAAVLAGVLLARSPAEAPAAP